MISENYEEFCEWIKSPKRDDNISRATPSFTVRCELHFYETKTSAEKAKKEKFSYFLKKTKKKPRVRELVGVAKISEAMER